MEPIIYLDTHVVVWLFAGRLDLLSSAAQARLNQNRLLVSPMAVLELHYLKEINRISAAPNAIVSDLETRLGLRTCGETFAQVVERASALTWTRDPFDRLIVAQTIVGNGRLLTKDETILAHFDGAVWD